MTDDVLPLLLSETLSDEAKDALRPWAQPFCAQWGTIIPSMEGPYPPEWAAHNNCGPHKHCYVIRREVLDGGH